MSGTSGALGHGFSLEGFGRRWRAFAQSRSAPREFSGSAPWDARGMTEPIELHPLRRSVSVEVASGAVTRVDFAVRPEFGVAGRVRAEDGSPISGLILTLLDETGHPSASTRTDGFGLYRLDGVVPGSYELEVSLPGSSRLMIGHSVILVDDFLFGVDLTVPEFTE